MKKNDIEYFNKSNRQKKHGLLYAFFYMCILIFMVGMNGYVNRLDFLNDSNAVFINPKDFEKDCSPQELKTEDGQIFTYKVTIPDSAFSNLVGDEYKLIINGIHDNAIKVWFNDQLVISVGDTKKGLSVLRTAHVDGSIEPSMIKTDNILKIRTYAGSRTGFINNIIFTEKILGERTVRFLTLFNENFVYMGLGFTLMSVFFILIIYALNRPRDKMFLYLSLATFFVSFYFLDYLPLNNLRYDYLLYKKVYLLSLSLGVFFYNMTLYTEIKKKILVVLSTMQLVYLTIVILAVREMSRFRFYYNYFYVSLFAMVLIFIIASIINIKKSDRVFIFVLHLSSLLLMFAFRLDLGFKSSYFSVAMPVYMLFIIGLLPMILTFDLFLEKDLKMSEEVELKDEAYQKSMTDDLTGVYNKRYLEICLSRLKSNTVIALVDLDNLKMINDTFGHLAGDLVLQTLTKTMKKHVRRSDDICRYGGDEFVIIFEDCTIENAVEIVEKIRLNVEKEFIPFDGSQLSTSISAGLCTATKNKDPEKIIACADRYLYKAKEKGKNRIEFMSLNG